LLPLARLSTIAAFFLLCVFSLWMRVYEWSSPVRLALAESVHNPTSPRAGYEYARTLVVLSGYRKDSPLVPEALKALTHVAGMPDSGILPDVGLIILASRTDNPVKADWWENIRKKLARRQPTVEDGEALRSLTECQRKGRCVLDDNEMLKVYLAATDKPAPSASTLYSYAIFAYNRLGDPELALRLARDAVKRSPSDQQYRVNLIDFLIALGRFDEARVELTLLRTNDRWGTMATDIRREDEVLSKKQ
jgi:tetratricopeptide (TPR) repeat protein